MEEKTDIPTYRCNNNIYPQLLSETRKHRLAPRTAHTETSGFNGSSSNDEVTLFNAELQSSCDVTNSSCQDDTLYHDSILTRQVTDLQKEKRKQQEEIAMLCCKLQKKKCKIRKLKAQHYAEIAELKKAQTASKPTECNHGVVLETLKQYTKFLLDSRMNNSAVLDTLKIVDQSIAQITALSAINLADVITKCDVLKQNIIGRNTIRLSSNPSFQLSTKSTYRPPSKLTDSRFVNNENVDTSNTSRGTNKSLNARSSKSINKTAKKENTTYCQVQSRARSPPANINNVVATTPEMNNCSMLENALKQMNSELGDYIRKMPSKIAKPYTNGRSGHGNGKCSV